jgi:hypothetical protein
MKPNEIKRCLENCAGGDCDDCIYNGDTAVLFYIKQLEAEKRNLEDTLLGVMHFVDKWLDEDELEQDEVNRADTMRHKTLQIIEEQQAEIEKLKKFKSYFDSLYGYGLEVINWHLNGELEPFDNFYDSAIQEMENKDNV